jgi:hypothetical protein
VTGKYSTKSEELLHYLALCGWADDETGHVEAPGGYVWIFEDLVDETAARGVEQWAAEHNLVMPPSQLSVITRDMTGSWVIVTDSDGSMGYYKYSSGPEADAAFEIRMQAYLLWEDSEDDHTSDLWTSRPVAENYRDR